MVCYPNNVIYVWHYLYVEGKYNDECLVSSYVSSKKIDSCVIFYFRGGYYCKGNVDTFSIPVKQYTI